MVGERIDEIEDKVERKTNNNLRPLRNAIESQLAKIPSGPFGKIGEGDLAGVVGYALIKTGQLAVLPIPGVRQPGFQVISHGVDTGGEFDTHTVRINAASRNIATFASEYEVSAPSNIDYITSEVESIKVETLTERPTYNTYEIVVEVADRGTTE